MGTSSNVRSLEGMNGFFHRVRLAGRYRLLKAQYVLDYLRYRDRYRYPTIYIACCPHSASSWLGYLLAEILTGFHSYFPKGQAVGQAGENYDVTEVVVRDLRWKLASVRSHTPATEANIAAMNAAFGKYLVLTRDVRDVILSAYRHVQKYPRSALVDYGRERVLPWRPVPPAIVGMEKDAGVDLLIDRLLPGLVSLSFDWLRYLRGTDHVLLIRYEDVTRDTLGEVRRILRFYELDVPDEQIAAGIERTSEALHRNESLHFRKGRSFGWRSELTPSQQEACERAAGPLLEALGYEVS